MFYGSEPDFTWSAGTYIWAYRELGLAFQKSAKEQNPPPDTKI
jgi:hypothetical protein